MMVNRAECEGGNQIDFIIKDGPIRCFHCGTELEVQGKVGCVTGVGDGATPNDELRELIEKWRKYGEPADKACADELESVIERDADGDSE